MSDLATLLHFPPAGDDQPAGSQQQAAVPAESSPVLAVTFKGGQRVSLGEQVQVAGRLAFREAGRRFGVMRHQRGGLLHSLFTERPPTLEEECGYAKSRAWVPAGHGGGWAEAHGVVYHAVIGRPMVAVGNTISGIGHKPFRWGVAFLSVFIATVCCLAGTGHGGIAGWLALAVAALAGLWCSAAAAVHRANNPHFTGAPEAGDDQPRA